MKIKEQIEIRKHGLVLELDSEQVLPDDPGQGTPAMIRLESNPECCATFWCAAGEGELDSDRDGFHQLNHDQVMWLDEMQDEVDQFIEKHSE